MANFIIKLAPGGKIDVLDFPDGSIREQNQFLSGEIGCDLYERVKPERLYTMFKCRREPLPKVPGEAVAMLIDESGALKTSPVNAVASYLYGMDKHGYAIHGTVLFVGERYTDEMELEFCSLEDFTCIALTENLSRMVECFREIDKNHEFIKES